MKSKGQKRRRFSRQLFIILALSILISIQIYSATLYQVNAAYYGVQFGTEGKVGSDGQNDIWQVEKSRYMYIANAQTKPEVDLLGMNVTRNANELVWNYDYEIFTLKSTNMTTYYMTDYNFSYIFNVSLSELVSVSYSFTTDQMFESSALNFYNWTAGAFYNDSAVENITSRVLNQSFYSSQSILLNLNVTHPTNYTWWFNVTYEFLYTANQVITLHFASLASGNASLVENLKTWIFVDMDGDDRQDYLIYWIYGSGVNIYEIGNDSFTLGGYWNGQWVEYWNGMRWKDILEGPRGSFSSVGVNILNITIPDYIINLTTTVHYGVWAQKIEASYDWWDALPDDPEWEITPPIPGFFPVIVEFTLLTIVLVYWIKVKKIQNLNKMKS